MEERCYLAFDLGAESGRAILGRLSGKRIFIQELTRFQNAPVRILGHLHWDAHCLYDEIKKGMMAGLAQAQVPVESLAVDTWGVDFGLLAGDGSLLGLPFAYRDSRTEGAMESFFRVMPREEVYRRTGIQFLPFNSLFQLYALIRDDPALLRKAETLLFMPDLFNYFLTGEKASEFTIASTSQLFDPLGADWDDRLLSCLGLSRRLLPRLLSPGTPLGPLCPDVSAETGMEGARVIAGPGHDTAAAVAGVPAEGSDWAFISSGTWSLLGIERPGPIINAGSLEANFTNEAGVGGTTRFLKNIAGLWLLRQCRKEWGAEASLDYEEMTRLAGQAEPFPAFIDPDWPGFLNPVSMPEAIKRYCLETRQSPPASPAATVRCILESLALKYRAVLDQLRGLIDRRISRLHVIGGGAKNGLLCRFTAEAAGLPVIAGPAEATAIGNIMVQAMASGAVASQAEARAVIHDSVELKRYEPEMGSEWERAYARFRDIISF